MHARHVYFAHPIDQAQDRSAAMTRVWSEMGWANTELGRRGYTTFIPGMAWHGPGAGSIVPVNDIALREAAGVLAWLPKGVSTIGVPMEIERATQLGIPVRVVTDVSSFALPQEIMVDTATEGLLELVEEIALVGLDRPFRRPLPVKLLSDAARLPTRGYDDDAGFDLYVSQTTILEPGRFTDVPNEVAMELPSDTWGMITGRSSTLRKRGLLVNPGIMDPGYRGPQFSGAWNLTNEPVKVEAGDRIAQLILFPNRTFEYLPIEAQALTASARGEAGFGSTGA